MSRRTTLAWVLMFVTTAASAPSQQLLFDELHRMLPAFELDTQAVVAFDADGDGDLDLVTAGTNGPDRLLSNDGTGYFTEQSGAIVGKLAPTNALAVGDVDGDGDADVLAGTSGINRLLLNDGTGLFTDLGAQYFTFLDSTADVALGDVDGDGDLDALFGNVGAQNRLYLNDGQGGFVDATSKLPGAVHGTTAVALADLDGDGDLDLAEGTGFDVRFAFNDGAGTFTAGAQSVAFSSEGFQFGDLDGDGDTDFLLAIGVYQGARLFFNDGTGVFSKGPKKLVSEWVHSIVLGDIDGDGDLDACAGLLDRVAVLENQGGGIFKKAGSQAPAGPLPVIQALALADLDGDLDLDLVAGTPKFAHLFLNRGGTGSFVDVTGPGGHSHSTALAVADVDGDGDPDVLFGNNCFGDEQLLLNDGEGLFAHSTSLTGPVSGPECTTGLAFGDLDRDGDQDVVVVRRKQKLFSGSERVYFNDGQGNYTLVQENIVMRPRAVDLGDLDGDGDLDALIANDYGVDDLLFNDGTGVFEAVPLHPAVSSTNAFIEDLDGDGDLDALLADSRSRLLLNSGSGAFVEAPHQLPDTGVPFQDAAFGDVDGDGDTDILLGRGGLDGLYLNDGLGTFTDASGRIPAPGNSNAVALGDLDGDGDLDAWMSGVNSAVADRIHLNDGHGFFTEATGRIRDFPDRTHAVVLVDLDGDGDLDAVLAKQAQNVIATNLTHQLAWRAVPRVGKPLTMDLYGPPGAVWELRTGWTPPPAGFDSDLAGWGDGLRFQGRLDERGRGSVTVAVPADPALVGRTLYWLAEIGTSPRHVAVTPTTLTDL